MKKRSNLLLILIFLCACIGVGLYADHIKHTIEPNVVKSYKSAEIVDGEEFIRKITLSYKHLHVEYPAVSIDGRYHDHIELSGIAAASDMVDYEVRRDTLYIRYDDQSSKYYKPYPNRFSELIGNRPLALRVHVGGIGLKSITLGKMGRISIPPTAYNRGDYGKTIYTEADIERYTLNYDTLDIVNGPVQMLLEGQVLNLYSTTHNRTGFSLQGQVDRLNVEYDGSGEVFLNYDHHYNLESKVARINTHKNEEGLVTGGLLFAVRDTLIANLYGAMDVNYFGDPEVIKYERSTGRVVHMN